MALAEKQKKTAWHYIFCNELWNNGITDQQKAA